MPCCRAIHRDLRAPTRVHTKRTVRFRARVSRGLKQGMNNHMPTALGKDCLRLAPPIDLRRWLRGQVRLRGVWWVATAHVTR